MAKNGEVCISILHEPGEDKYGYERPEERWLPIHTVETIMISVISMLADPNGDSPANVDAAVSSHSLEMLLLFVDATGSWGGLPVSCDQGSGVLVGGLSLCWVSDSGSSYRRSGEKIHKESSRGRWPAASGGVRRRCPTDLLVSCSCHTSAPPEESPPFPTPMDAFFPLLCT